MSGSSIKPGERTLSIFVYFIYVCLAKLSVSSSGVSSTTMDFDVIGPHTPN